MTSTSRDAPRRPAIRFALPSRSRVHGGRRRLRARQELTRFIPGRSRFTLPGIALTLIEPLPARFGARVRELLELGVELRNELHERLGDDGVMLFPSHAAIAPRHHVPQLLPFRWVYSAILNVMEMPATQVPLGLDRRGLPLGVQAVAPRHADHLAIAVALELERLFGGWVAPPRFAAA